MIQTGTDGKPGEGAGGVDVTKLPQSVPQTFSGGCAVCEGGWQRYWQIVFSPSHNAQVCEDHLRENAESAK